VYRTVTVTSPPIFGRVPTSTVAPGSVRRAARGAHGTTRVGIDAGRARGFARRMHDRHLVAHHEADLDDCQCGEHHERKQESELHRGLTALGSPTTTVGEPVTYLHPGSTLLMTLSNSFEIA